jgi:hypothetical protein
MVSGGYDYQLEVILPRNTKYKIDKIHKNWKVDSGFGEHFTTHLIEVSVVK